MKQLFIMLSTLVFVGCSSDAQTEKSAKMFLENYYGQDFKEAKKYASQKTVAEIDDILNSSDISLEPLADSERPIIEIKDILINGDTAYCRFILSKESEDASAMSETLVLVQENGQWRAEL